MEGAWIKWTHKGGTLNGKRIAKVLERSDGDKPDSKINKELKEKIEHVSYEKFQELKKAGQLLF